MYNISTNNSSDLFTLSGSPYTGDAKMEGQPLRTEDLFKVLNQSLSGMDENELLFYYRSRKDLIENKNQIPDSSLVIPKDIKGIADDAIKNIFHILYPFANYEPYDYGSDIDWDANPVNDVEWPAGMNRFHYWDAALTNCYRATGTEDYAKTWVRLVTDWIYKNPLTLERLPFGHSWDAIQVGIRCQRLAHTIPYYINSNAFTPKFLVDVLTSLYNHARRIELMPYPGNGNFAMIETIGLACIAVVFPEFREAEKWGEIAIQRMTDSLREQVKPDGVHAELCPNYHVLITNHYLDLIDLFGIEKITSEIREATELMAEFCMAISMPNRLIFSVGDTSTRFSLKPLLENAGRILGRTDFLTVAGAEEGIDTVASEISKRNWPQKRNYAFKDGGFYTFRSGWDSQAIWLGLHCGGESNRGKNAFHSQFDRGTFELMAFGRILMRDPGVYNYKPNDPGREAFRSTAAHQTLTLNNMNSVNAGKYLQWVDDDGEGNAILTVENHAYTDLVHRRTVFFVQQKLFVFVDEALGTATGDIDLHFQLTPGPAVIDISNKTAHTGFADGGNVIVWGDKETTVTMESEVAWYSPKWHIKEPLPAFRFHQIKQNASVRFITIIAPYQGTSAPNICAKVEKDSLIGDDKLVVDLTIDGDGYRLRRCL